MLLLLVVCGCFSLERGLFIKFLFEVLACAVIDLCYLYFTCTAKNV